MSSKPLTDLELVEILRRNEGSVDYYTMAILIAEIRRLRDVYRSVTADYDLFFNAVDECGGHLDGGESTVEAVVRLLTEKVRIENEVRRLKRGDFTPEEFQNLCHHRDEKPGCTPEEFAAGCAEYQRKLFGGAAEEAWTREPPTAAGEYWWRDEGSLPRVVTVFDWRGGGVACVFRSRSHNPDGITTPQHVGGLWCGPLTPPPFPAR